MSGKERKMRQRWNSQPVGHPGLGSDRENTTMTKTSQERKKEQKIEKAASVKRQ